MLTKKCKILFVCPYPYDVQAGQRLKFEPSYEIFKKNNYQIYTAPFFNISTWKILHKKGFILKKIYGTILGYFKRIFQILNLYSYDIIYIHMWVTPFGGYLFELIFKIFSRRIIYDIEDNILLIKKSEINPISSFFKSAKKTNYLIKNSDHIITSSPELNKKCLSISKKNNTTYISPTINTNRYKPLKIHNQKNEITIGWTGTISSKKYLKIVEPVLVKLSKTKKIKFLVIGNFFYELEGVKTETIFWNKENEINDLLKIDIGIYPLFDDEWVSGKSGLKALQYMALGIPPVVTNVGNNLNIIENGRNGFLVNNQEDWYNIFLKLIDDSNIRNKIGKEANKTINKFYSIDIVSKKYINIFNKLS
tara:strand:- start:1577 stop:2668 length:1092 start_codon:yes stop_codon:yes gene_type:complete